MKDKFSWHSFIALPFLLGLFFIVGLSSVKAVTVYGVTTSNQLVSLSRQILNTILKRTNCLRITSHSKKQLNVFTMILKFVETNLSKTVIN
jgi:hypothetical protein